MNKKAIHAVLGRIGMFIGKTKNRLKSLWDFEGEEEAQKALQDVVTLDRLLKEGGPGPEIVCLCGSTKFKSEWLRATLAEGLSGRIVLSIACFMHADSVGIKPDQKVRLDELHKRKIDLADSILVIDVGGYIGSSTKSEIEYAEKEGKRIRYWSAESCPGIAIGDGNFSGCTAPYGDDCPECGGSGYKKKVEAARA